MKAMLLVLVAAVGCGPSSGDGTDDVRISPDGRVLCVGHVQILAPVANLHYDAGLEVYIDESEAYDFQQAMYDSDGLFYGYTDQSSVTDPMSFTTHHRFHYDLAPSKGYTLTVSHCEETQSVSFFTSAP